jgi:hypothetical protein
MFLTTIKSNHTFNQTLKLYTQTTEKVLFEKITFFQPQPQQQQQYQTHSYYTRGPGLKMAEGW